MASCTIYCRIDKKIATQIDSIAQKEGVKKVDLICKLIKKGLETYQANEEAELSSDYYRGLCLALGSLIGYLERMREERMKEKEKEENREVVVKKEA